MKHLSAIHDEVVEVAKVQNRIAAWRAAIAVLLGVLSAAPLGTIAAATWTAAMLACELWTKIATKPALSGSMSPRQIIAYIISGFATVPCWSALGALYWLSDVSGSEQIAIVLWAAQIINTQRFIYQSPLAILIGNMSTTGLILLLPFFAPKLEPQMQLTLSIGFLLCIGFAVSGALMTMRNIRSLNAEKAAVEYGATHDALTGLSNRFSLQRHLAQAFNGSNKHALLLIDLDHFKQVNDLLGHQAGDALLQEFSSRLTAIAPNHSNVARLGGDEFALLMQFDGDQGDPERVCKLIVETTSEPFLLAEGVAHVGASIGLALSPEHGRNPADLMRKADIALYESKAAGRNTFVLFNGKIEQKMRERSLVESGLRKSLETGEGLELHYQPKLNADGTVNSFEALLRWSNSKAGFIEPSLVIEIAEETGLIGPLGEWVFTTAMDFAGRWPGFGLSVNVSAAQLKMPKFAGWMIDQTSAHNIPPSRMELEVTETAFLDDSSHTQAALRKLRGAGFSIALDDFGTGYSSLRHLYNLTVDKIKIDRSFVSNLCNDERARAIVVASIQMGHTLGLKVTAEGVETVEQVELLKAAGVDELQGFLFSTAKPEAELATFLAELRKNDETKLRVA